MNAVVLGIVLMVVLVSAVAAAIKLAKARKPAGAGRSEGSWVF